MPSPSSPLSFESRKYLPTQLALLYEPEHELFHIGSSYGSRRTFIASVPLAEIGPWLAEHCIRDEREHYDRLADAHARAQMFESLSIENLRAVDGLDLGIDL